MQPPREIPPVSRPGPVVPLPPSRREVKPQPAAEDRVALSQEGQWWLELRRRAQQAPEVREDLVARLREAVRKGEYRPPASEIARHLVRVLRPRP